MAFFYSFLLFFLFSFYICRKELYGQLNHNFLLIVISIIILILILLDIIFFLIIYRLNKSFNLFELELKKIIDSDDISLEKF